LFLGILYQRLKIVTDLAGLETISSEHVSEAIQYRSLDRNFWDDF